MADDHTAALSVGISLNQIWAIVWFASGIVALATGMVFTAVSTGLDGLHNGIEAGFAHESREVLYVPISQISLFALLVIGAIAFRRKLDYHKRLMVLATIAILPPATARFCPKRSRMLWRS